MKALDRLLWSDIRRIWRQGLAICAVLACGVATFVMSTSTIRSLDTTRERYYRDFRFADLFVRLVRAPNRLGARLAEIPGVARVETRVVRDVVLDLPTMVEPASARLISISEDPELMLNGIYLRTGRWPAPNRRGEILASETFAAAHRLTPGDQLSVIMNGKKERLTIVGLGMSPEFIYAMPPGQLLPDNRRFGVLWMSHRQMAAAFNMEGAFNDVAIQLRPHVSARDVIFHVDTLTRPYGGSGAFGREDQASHRRVADEMAQTKNMAFVTPTIFLAVSAFLLNMVFSRLIHQQQEQIATLRAFGYRSTEIGWHYLKLLLFLVILGGIMGVAAGMYFSRSITALYGRFFRFPVLTFRIGWDSIAMACLLSIAAALAGGLSAVRRAMRLPPAVAMRPEPPPSYRRTILERLGLRWMLSPVALMVVRRLERNARATALSVLGMALAVGVLVLGSFMEDTINYVMDVQFELAQRQDVTLTFYEPLSPHVLHDAEQLPGVVTAEPFRAAAVRLHAGVRSRRMALMGLQSAPRLFRILDDQRRDVKISERGLTISRKLAELLEVKLGDEIQVEFLEGRQRTRWAQITAIFPDYTEPGAYLRLPELDRLLGEGPAYSGVFLAVDPLYLPDLHAELKSTPYVAGVTVTRAARQSFRETIAENLRPMRIINAFFASIIAFGVIYNCALIALAERNRDLATMRVLGFTRGEVAGVLMGELAVIVLAAIPVGLPVGYFLASLAAQALDTETHRFPLVIHRATFAYASAMILVAAAISLLAVRRKLDSLDLIAVLKVKE